MQGEEESLQNQKHLDFCNQDICLYSQHLCFEIDIERGSLPMKSLTEDGWVRCKAQLAYSFVVVF